MAVNKRSGFHAPVDVSEHGFTLIEILISLALFAIVISAIYSSFQVQQKSYIVQEQVAAVQQNIRAAMYYMTREIRMAGFDPDGGTSAGITVAQPGQITFTQLAENDSEDNDSDGTVDELGELKTMTYSLYDSESDGDNDLGVLIGAGNNLPVAMNVDALNFVYLNGNGAALNAGLTSVSASNLSNIRAIEIALVVRAERPDMEFTESTVYTNKRAETIYTAPGDSFRRRVLTTTVSCRNL